MEIGWLLCSRRWHRQATCLDNQLGVRFALDAAHVADLRCPVDCLFGVVRRHDEVGAQLAQHGGVGADVRRSLAEQVAQIRRGRDDGQAAGGQLRQRVDFGLIEGGAEEAHHRTLPDRFVGFVFQPFDV